MIVKECTSLRQEGEQDNLVQPKYWDCSYINLSVEEAEEKICRELLAIPRQGGVAAVELEGRLCLATYTFVRALHELAKRRLVTVKGSIVKANRRTREAVEG